MPKNEIKFLTFHVSSFVQEFMKWKNKFVFKEQLKIYFINIKVKVKISKIFGLMLFGIYYYYLHV